MSTSGVPVAGTAKAELLAHVLGEAVIGVVREDDAGDALAVALACRQGGLRTLEITFTTPRAVELIERLAGDGGGVVAAGTLRSVADAESARVAGAGILVSPHTDERIVRYAAAHDLLMVAGAATPTEIVRAREAGADIVKVYPAPQLGGPGYIRTVRQPIRDVPMLAGGPLELEDVAAYLDAGAVAVNLGGSLAPPEVVAGRRWDEVGARARRACEIVAAWRAARAALADGAHGSAPEGRTGG
ncbi:MAG: bifunctional 4-hydroxy-2-oxoglutarate aldolase/2-dehydro-3-deoxy-phosphogluconate aldolase [Gemmatimonadota bacterium]